MTRNSNGLDSLSSPELKTRASQWGLIFIQLSVNASLWSVYYFLCRWLGNTLQFQKSAAFPVVPVALAAVSFTLLILLGVRLRHRAGARLQRLFYHKLYAELDSKRWALIRSKPMTAWQDVSFRHLPAMESYLLDYQPQRTLILFVPLAVLVIIFPISWLAGLILFLTLPLMPLFMWLVGAGTASVQKKHMTALNRLGLFFADRIKGASTVRILNQQSQQMNAFERASDEHNRRLAEVIRLAFLNSSVLDFFATVSMALVAVFIGFHLLGEIPFGFYGSPSTLENGLFILLLSPSFFAELKKLGKLYHVKSEALASSELWHHTLAWHSTNSTVHAPVSEKFHSLVINNTRLSGFDGEPLIEFQQCALNASERILLTGASGSGKSVVLDALAGLRPTHGGTCRVNGKASPDIRILRDQCFYSGQFPIFFDGTLRENLGLNQFDDTAIQAAIEAVEMGDWFQRLTEGLDTQLDEHTPLSGGQKQKLALARLKLFDQPIVLLDEPLAHLSVEEQSELLPILLAFTERRASVWVSHISLPEAHFTKRWTLTDKTLTEARL